MIALWLIYYLYKISVYTYNIRITLHSLLPCRFGYLEISIDINIVKLPCQEHLRPKIFSCRELALHAFTAYHCRTINKPER